MSCRTVFFAWMSGLLLTLAACGDAPSVDENLVETFVELRVAEQMYGSETPMARLARSKTLEKHGYTRETFLAMTDNILADPHYWMPFQKRVTDRIDSVLDPEAVHIRDLRQSRKDAFSVGITESALYIVLGIQALIDLACIRAELHILIHQVFHFITANQF